MPCTDDPDLFSVGCFGSVESAQGVKSFLWEEHAIVSALKTVMVGPFPVVRLLVARPDFPEASKLISSLDQTEWGWIAPERYTSVVQELVDRLIFLDDKPTEGEQPGSGHGFAADVPGRKEKVIEQIRMMFGEEEARRMVAAFDSSEQASDTRPEASVVMLMHNKWKHTERALWGLLQTRNVRWELILVDNGSTDKEVKNGVTSYLNECLVHDIPVRLITFSENVGAVRGRNEALPHCRGSYIVFMDNDVVVRSKGWLRTAIDHLAANPDIGAIGAKLVYPNQPHLIQCAGCDVSPTGRVNFRGRGELSETPEFNVLRDVQCLISACIVFPRRVVQEVGLLDMAYHPVQFEDTDYCYRIREKGYRCVYHPGVQVYHFENVTTGGTKKLNYTYLTVKNGKVFKDRWAHMYSKEDGPDERSMVWKDIASVSISEIGELEVVD